MEIKKSSVVIVGAGLAGCECALTLARFGIRSVIYEQKPVHYSPAHTSTDLGELVCSNSFRSDVSEGAQSTGVGILKAEMRALDSAIMSVAEEHRVPAGKALAVDRDLFARALTKRMSENHLISIVHEQVNSLEDVENKDASHVIIAAGPLASDALACSLANRIGSEHCYFYDAIAPIVNAESLDMSIIFRGSRYENLAPPPYNDEIANDAELSTIWREKMLAEIADLQLENEPHESSEGSETLGVCESCEANEHNKVSGRSSELNEPNGWVQNPRQDTVKANTAEQDDIQETGDYLNCPMHKHEYLAFYNALLDAEKVAAHNFEKEVHFEGCMPIESLASRGDRTLTFGPLKPVGFTDPRTGRRPYAIMQLRAENLEKSSYNLVGCQTKMTYQAQNSVFRLIPGLEHVEFSRFGSMHRNTYVNAPKCLGKDLELLASPHVYLAGQISGVEGYVESAACGLWLALILISKIYGFTVKDLSQNTALGALMAHLRNDSTKNFQPSNVHFGLMPSLEGKINKKNRKTIMAQRASDDFQAWLASMQEDFTKYVSE